MVPRRVLELTITEGSKGSEITQFAKTPIIVRTSLELFVSTNCINSVSEFRMSVNTLKLLVTVPILRKITTNWQLVGIVRMQVVTGFSSRASLFYPMDTDKFFAFLFINVVLQTLIYGG